ncbi:MAG: glutamine-hydrolyzing GMP synthase [Deltaproteobacteria bacterium]|nr:glutamine-hydrolyzing GMP synthase [Deltaproteobacteria bacterium]
MDKVLILDFGSQYTQLIARRIREFHVYSEIQPYNYPLAKIIEFAPKAIILSGGPASVLGDDAPSLPIEVLNLGIPLLGVCYGMQLLTKLAGGTVAKAQFREYGRATLKVVEPSGLFEGMKSSSTIWMSHGDSILTLPPHFIKLAESIDAPIVAMAFPAKKIYALQFHPEVSHTEEGALILENFLFKIAGCNPNWNMSSFVERTLQEIRKTVGHEKVICGVSGGVDSTVTAVLIHKAIGDQLQCIFINNGLLRKKEAEKVISTFAKNFHIPLHYVDASARFLKKLAGIVDPEMKRKIIGNEFIFIFEEEAKKFAAAQFLAQGTLYPDVIESVSFKGPSAVIKSHHNVGGLPKNMKFKLVEPLKELFKDEVRRVGETLGISRELTHRHPFPGPGLAVRILGPVTPEGVALLQEADDIIVSEIKTAGFYDKVWQVFGVLLPVKSVGVMGDERTYANVLAIRCVQSTDGMTADWVPLPFDLLSKMSNRIINQVSGINRVVYDISSKPPSTIEWE